MSLGTWILDELNKGKKYFGIGQAGLGQFGSDVKNIANTTENRISTGIDKYKNWENALRTKAYGNETARAIENIPKLGAKSVIAPMVQGTARSFASLIPAVTNKPIQVNNTLRKALFGSQYQDIQKPTFEGVRNLQDLGFKEGTAKKYGPAFGVAMTALDVIPGMGGKDDLVKGLVKATTKSRVKKLLPKVADDVAETIAKTTDARAIRGLLSKTDNSLDALRGEARKYKSAEEFVNETAIRHQTAEIQPIKNPNDIVLYHGTAVRNYDSLTKPPLEKSTMDRIYGDYFYATNKRAETETYGRYVAQLNIPKEKILTLDQYRQLPSPKPSDEQLFKKYWAIEAPDNEFIIKDVNKVKEYTKSQLTDIWNKSQSPTPKTSKIPLKDDAKIPIKVDALKNEARKYKSAEEFANNKITRDFVSEVIPEKSMGTKGSSLFTKTSSARAKAREINDRVVEIAKRDQETFNLLKNKPIKELEAKLAETKKFFDEQNASHPRSERIMQYIIDEKKRLTDFYNQSLSTTKSRVKKLLPKIADDVAETIAKTTDVNAIRNLIEPKKGLDALSNEARNNNVSIFGNKINEEKIASQKADFQKMRDYQFKYKVGDKVKTSNGNEIISDMYIQDGQPRYTTYPAGKKNSYGYYTWSHEKDLQPVTKNVTVKSNNPYTKENVEQLLDANPQNDQINKLYYSLRDYNGDVSDVLSPKEKNLIDKFSSQPLSTPKTAKISLSEQPKIKLSTEKPQTAPLKTETPPIKPEMATVEQAISHPDKVAKAIQVGVDPSFEKIVAKTPATVKEKVNILDYIRTPDRVMKKIGLGKETEVLRKSYDKYLDEIPKEIDKIKVWANQSTPQENQNIFRYLDGQKVSLSAKEQKIASEVQSYLKDWADKLKLPQDKRISNYITHIFEKDFIGKEFPEDIAKIIQDRVPGSVYDPFTEQRLGKLGYVEDTWRALDAYVKRATRKYNLDPVLGNISKKADALEQSQYKYVKNYLDRINMRPTEVDNLVDNFIKSTPIGYKLGQRPTTALTRTGRQMVYRGTLGLNVSSALKNLSQGANTYAKLGEKYTAKGYFDLAKNWRSDELQRVGILRDNFIQDKQIGVYKQALEKVDKGLFPLFEGAEKVNRGAAYYGAKAKALAQGKTEQEAIDFAKKIVRDTQFTFGSIDTPVAMQSDLVKLATQFQSFTVKQGEFLGEMVASKDIAGLARWLGASLLFVYGVGELFGMEPKDLIPTVRIGTPPVIQGAVQGTKYLLKSPNKYGQPTSLKDVGNAFLPFVPAGVQLKKTIEGLGAANRGYSQTSSGNVRYPVEQNITNKIRGGLFGQYNFNEAKEYFNKGRSALSEQQSEIFKLGGGAGYYGKVMGDRESSKQAEEEMKALKSNKKTTAQDLGEGVYQLSNGKFYVQSLDKSFSDVKDADIAVKGDSFLKSGKKELITDDYVFEKADTDKGYKATPRIDYEIDVRDGTYGTLATLKKNKDIEGWMKEAETLVALYDAKLQDPDITSKEKRELEGKKRSLEDSMSKYASYGGFTKGSSKSKKIKLNTSGITTTKLSATKPSAPSAGTMPSKYAKLQVKKGNPNVKFTSLRGAATGTKKKGARILRGKKYGA